jgi:hypothetical protein
MSFGEARWLRPDGEFTFGEFNLLEITDNRRRSPWSLFVAGALFVLGDWWLAHGVQ